jgi:hypothetical protein
LIDLAYRDAGASSAELMPRRCDVQIDAADSTVNDDDRHVRHLL